MNEECSMTVAMVTSLVLICRATVSSICGRERKREREKVRVALPLNNTELIILSFCLINKHIIIDHYAQIDYILCDFPSVQLY